jgi:hypothetical protein
MEKDRRPFNQKTAKILKFILDSQISEKPATRKDIAKFIGKSTVWVGNLLARLENDQRGFLKHEDAPSDSLGNLPYQYKLIRGKIVTNPLTAWITLELHKETQIHIEKEVDRATFERKVVDKLKRSNYKSEDDIDIEELVKQKISALITIEDIVAAAPPQTNIYLDDTRFNQQRAFLELLAEDLKIDRQNTSN